MVAFTKYQDTVEKMWTAIHDLTAAGHVVRAIIHTDAPTVATDDEIADLTQISGTGYPGSNDTANDMTEAGGTATWTGVDVTWTAGASDWTAGARYVSLYNDTSTGDKLLGSYDYGAGGFTLLNGETFTLDFGASVATLV
jgi:hypothetical protein